MLVWSTDIEDQGSGREEGGTGAIQQDACAGSVFDWAITGVKVCDADVTGKTAEAKTDLARLQEVRRRREAAAAQREAEAAGELPVDIRIPSANEQRPPRRPRRRRQRRRARRYKRHTGNLDLEYAPNRRHRATCVFLSSSTIIVYRLQIFFHASVPTSRT